MTEQLIAQTILTLIFFFLLLLMILGAYAASRIGRHE